MLAVHRPLIRIPTDPEDSSKLTDSKKLSIEKSSESNCDKSQRSSHYPSSNLFDSRYNSSEDPNPTTAKFIIQLEKWKNLGKIRSILKSSDSTGGSRIARYRVSDAVQCLEESRLEKNRAIDSVLVGGFSFFCAGLAVSATRGSFADGASTGETSD